jgi:hypothetical protein
LENLLLSRSNEENFKGYQGEKMNLYKISMVIMLAVFLIIPAAAENQSVKKGNDTKSNSSGSGFYVNQKRQIDGEIVDVQQVSYGNGQSKGVCVRVRTRKGNKIYDVHLGPDDVISGSNMSFKPGDNVSIDSFQGSFQGQTAYYASSVNKDGEILNLRDEKGASSWQKGSGSSRMSGNSQSSTGKGSSSGKGKGKGGKGKKKK